MNTSPVTSWEGAEAYFTFGPNSFGVWLSVVLGVALFAAFIVYSMRHEKHSFKESVEKYPELVRKLEASSLKERAPAKPMPTLPAMPAMTMPNPES
ncbi:hypothetical protein [Paenibacillus sp.]|uniref:hypothetical protein n=1 Tax=Paenibacillus sp. TaxID=58172 RepID=UPI002D2CCD52|nr:hypothetical protein [Paenibacillus sp.]HZG88553.1 hypothetical protein [Paenibacillus sp.]